MYPHIALIGKARSGKDTVATLIGQQTTCAKLSFAAGLKTAAYEVDPIICCRYDNPARTLRLQDVVDTYGWERAKDFSEVRRFLQAYGQTIREMDDRFWIRPVMTKIANLTVGRIPAVVTDVRYANEARILREAGAVTVRIVRPGAGLEGSAGAHSSETELDDYEPDYVVDNSGDMEHLTREVAGLLAFLR